MLKRLTLLLLVCTLSVCTLKAQTLSIYYTFSSSAGTYTSITGGTVLGTTSVDDDIYINPSTPAGATLDNPITGPGFNIGFTFSFNGFGYNRIGISTNGWIALGQSSLTPAVDMSTSLTFPASTGFYEAFNGVGYGGQPAALQNRIAAFDLDLQATTGSEIRIETIGSAPNRTCVVQWSGYRKYTAGSSTDNFNFQIRLNESSNTIEFVYGPFVSGGEFVNPLPAVGLGMGSDYLIRTTTTDWAATTAGVTASAKLLLSATVFPSPSGLTYLWTPSPSMPLPVNLTGFQATAKKGDVLLSWSTATEQNNAGFDIERSVDGKVFENVGFVKGAGNSSALLNYNQTDYNAFTKAGSNTLYYRLVQKDFDGKKSLSDVVMVASTDKTTSMVEAFPNPFSKSLSLKIVSAHTGSYIVEMADLQGKIVGRASINLVKGANLIVVNDFSSLNPGVYFMKIKDLDNTLIKLVKTN